MPAAAQSAANAAAHSTGDAELRVLLRHLIAELASLRAELRQDRAERHEAKIATLESELRHLQAERHKLDEQEQGQAAEVAEFDEQLQQPNLDPRERAAIEASRAHFIATAPAQTRATRASLLERERAMSERLRGEQQLRQSLLITNGSSVQK